MGENHSQQPAESGTAAPPLSSADWAADSSRRWLAHADALEAQLEPVHAPLLAACGDLRDARVLEVGCGRGATTQVLAEGVGPGGHVTAVDISEALVAAAGARLPDAGRDRIDLRLGDAQTLDLGAGTFDVVASRFGVMFFDDPVAAFANLGHATRPGGQLAIAVWQPRDRSPTQQRGLDVAVATAADLGHHLELGDPHAGPFSLGLPEVATGVLEAAGWVDVHHDAQLVRLPIAGGGATPEQALEVAFAIGPLRILLADAPGEVTVAVRAALLADYAALHDGSAMWVDGGIAIVQARRPERAPTSS